MGGPEPRCEEGHRKLGGTGHRHGQCLPVVAPGRIPERRIQQIIASCEQAPEWPEISRIRATDEHVLNQRIFLWDPETQRYEDRIITAYTFKYPPRPYNVLVLQATAPQT
ncbi:hypothetical protein IU427_30085 [Nocardia beijingensis]|uniref:hypothetical protein n=1 Tax=Nocardia beijingensis TaxID=95162 RepID=UPI001893358D|nr:hypothetical protein [Nocardia beijingensis]MBF6469386.1 hypothetical protein [Nocardia beijingensis]